MNIYSFFVALFLFPTIIFSQVLTDLEQRDLQLTTCYNGTSGLIDSVSRTKTTIGYNYFKHQLSNPLTQAEQLRQRQANVRLLLSDSELCKNAVHELELFAQHQSVLHSLPHDNATCKKMLQRFYFKNQYTQWLNNYPAGLECGQLLQVVALFAPVIEHAVIHFLVNEKLHSYLGMCCSHSHHKHKKHHHHAAPSLVAQAAYYAYNIAHGAIHIMSCKELLEHVYQQYAVIREMQNFLSHVRVCLQVRDRLNQSMSAYPEFSELLNSHTLSADCCEFIELVKNSAKVTHLEIARPGNILRAYALFESVQDELIEYCKPVAVTDFYYSIATLFKQFENSSTPYNFCEYDDSTTHAIIDGFWNPLFAHPQSIDFTITAGKSEPHCMIFTGQNKAGKSTNLYAIATCIVLGQSLGIAPAQVCSFSPFERIYTGFNMPARVVEGASLFTTTVEFTQEIAQVAQSNRTFVVLDELFNSTHHTKGCAVAQLFLQRIAAQPNVIALVSTHLSGLSDLQMQYPDLFTALMVERIDADDDYVIKRGFLPVTEYEETFDPDALYTFDV